MPATYITALSICAFFALFVFWLLLRWKLRRERRCRLFREPVPEHWGIYLRRNLRFYSALPEEEKVRLKGLIKVFLDEKNFEGCGGIEMSDEIKVSIAGQACLLVLRHDRLDLYPGLRTVLVYPSAYRARDDSGPVSSVQGRLGESWNFGVVVLSWSDSLSGGLNDRDGHNVVMHEFAHQLDQENGASDGTPVFPGTDSAYREWGRILGREFKELKSLVEKHKRDVIDDYGATSPAEFFAVATETFFEKPNRMSSDHPELFEELKEYFRLDPLQWKDKT